MIKAVAIFAAWMFLMLMMTGCDGIVGFGIKWSRESEPAGDMELDYTTGAEQKENQ